MKRRDAEREVEETGDVDGLIGQEVDDVVECSDWLSNVVYGHQSIP